MQTSSDFLRTVLDKHAPASLQKAMTLNSSPWLESMRDVLLLAKREMRQAERNTKYTIFKDMYGQVELKVSKTCTHSQV